MLSYIRLALPVGPGRTTFGEMPVLLGMLPLLWGLGRGKGPLLLLAMGVTGDAAARILGNEAHHVR